MENHEKHWHRDPIANSPRGGRRNYEVFDASGGSDYAKGYEMDRGQAYEMAYDQRFDTDEATNQEKFKQFIDSLTGDECWLDLGSGLGSAIVHFVEHMGKVKSENLFSIDLDIANLRHQQEARLIGHKIHADAANLPITDGGIDILVAHLLVADNKINGSVKFEQIRREITRVIKRGGIVITERWGGEVLDADQFEKLFEFNLPVGGTLDFYQKKR